MRIVSFAALALGCCVVIALVANVGLSSIAYLLSKVGWCLMWLIPLHAIVLGFDVIGWRTLILAPTRFRSLFLISAIREAINRLLPVANVGGELVGVHLMMRQGTTSAVSAASIIIEMLLNVFSQYVLAGAGLVCVLSLTGRVQPSSLILLMSALLIPVFLGIALLVVTRAFSGRIKATVLPLFTALATRVSPLANLKLLQDSIRQVLASPPRLVAASGWQITGLLIGCSEIWLVLGWLGHPISFPAAVALESLTQAAKSVFFFVPTGVGVQEVGLVGIGRILGIDPELALALSLVKRLREIIFGLPALGLWQRIAGFSAPQP